VASSTERIRVKLPANFDPPRHMTQLMKKIADVVARPGGVSSGQRGHANGPGPP
jgi:hypothetical protein